MAEDKRKVRRGHRRSADNLLNGGGLFNSFSARGSTFHYVAMWHLKRARNFKR